MLRTPEKEIQQLDGINSAHIYLAVYDMRSGVILNAQLGILTTFLVCIVLSSGAAIFSKLTTDLVITPIEIMIEKVNNITKDPLKAAHDEEERLLIQELAEKDEDNYSIEIEDPDERDKKRKEDDEKRKKKEKEGQGPLETVLLEQTLSKIGSLLALVFGEAGAEIIAKNMEKGSDVNPMLPGHKAIFIFGFCDIRNFTDATEVLEEGVMLFVNEIGDIVHSTVSRYSGAANKNVGDAFLLVWKMDKQDQ